MPEGTIHILAVDDHPLMREGIVAVLGGQSDMSVTWEAGDGEEALALYDRHRPDVVLMDLRMPRMDGVTAIREICTAFPDAKILVLTTYHGDIQALRALRAGARGYLLKSTLRRELIETIREVHDGKRRIPPGLAHVLAQHADDDMLTARELAVLECLAKGDANKTIAASLGISADTVKVHLKNIFAKLGAKDRTHAVTLGLMRGIIATQA